jgi:hypothetical protein
MFRKDKFHTRVSFSHSGLIYILDYFLKYYKAINITFYLNNKISSFAKQKLSELNNYDHPIEFVLYSLLAVNEKLLRLLYYNVILTVSLCYNPSRKYPGSLLVNLIVLFTFIFTVTWKS